jgi:hypothetical protein
MFDQFNSSRIVEILNEKILKLIEIKSNINEFQLDGEISLNFNELHKKVLLAKMPSFKFVPIFGIFLIPEQQNNLTSQEIIELLVLS